jgi:histidine ammonia-lyase
MSSGKAPDLLHSAVDSVGRRYESFLRHAESLPPGSAIYGTTTLPGHRDGTAVLLAEQDAYQRNLVASHAIAGSPFLSAAAARGVTLAKACSLLPDPAAPISAELYRHILLSFEDPGFKAQIPADASYGSGDVIPAAHWANAILARAGAPKDLQPGEGMTLINGAFVHVGATLAALDRVEELWQQMLVALRHSIGTLAPDTDCLAPFPAMHDVAASALEWLGSSAPPQSPYPRQQAVVLRTIPQLLEGFSATAAHLASALADTLSRPSGNPLFTEGPPSKHLVSGSFLAPALTIATSAMVDAVLMAGWAAQRRLSHLVELDYTTSPSAATMGLVQWPKLAEARLQTARRICGLRAFAGGGTTSEGIEDFWAFGLETLTALDAAAQAVEDIVSLERSATQWLAERRGQPRRLSPCPGLPEARIFSLSSFAPIRAGVPLLF